VPAHPEEEEEEKKKKKMRHPRERQELEGDICGRGMA